jgi:hypothetical protein
LVRESENSVAAAAEYLGLPEHHVRAAVDYYADFTEEVDRYNEIAVQLRAAGHDAVTVSERGLKGTATSRCLRSPPARTALSSPTTRATYFRYVETLRQLIEANARPRELANRVRWLP